MAGKFELYKDKAGEFRFRLKAGNGENILASEGYKDKSGAENGIASVKKNAGDKARFEVKESSSGKPYFVLKAANHQVIGQSQMYDSASGAENGIQSVMNNAPDASVDDQTG
ncbi:YegP family protein [Hyphococcus formosus]|uniref:YegP family protein n=1 Tax=Hyphococcus formosus TaxID=3143534 RepID=UPI00398B438F